MLSEDAVHCGPHGDSWDITESVGTTALGVAACRAIETGRDRPTDPRPVRAPAGLGGGPGLGADGRRAHGLVDGDDEAEPAARFESAVDYQAVRTHFFDELLRRRRRGPDPPGGDPGLRPGLAGLPAGLAGRHRGLRDRPAQGAQLQGGHAAGEHGVAPRADAPSGRGRPARRLGRRAASAGLRPRRPTAWLAEGLLPYLPADAQDRLFDIVTDAQRAGQPDRGRGVRHSRRQTAASERRVARRQRQARVGSGWAPSDVDVETLIYNEPDRADADVGWPTRLAGRHRSTQPTTRWPGWAVRCRPTWPPRASAAT